MNTQSQTVTKSNLSFLELISQINRLKKKLISYGYSSKEVIDIIFQQFLNLPQIQWSALRQTKAYHDIKAKHKVGSQSAEIILRLQKKIPNLHSYEVCDHLLAVLEINASLYGFNLAQSSCQSNDSGSGPQRLIHRKIKRKLKTTNKKGEQEQRCIKLECEKQKQKRIHYDKKYEETRNLQMKMFGIFREKQQKNSFQFPQYEMEKQLKKAPDSEDSDHIQ